MGRRASAGWAVAFTVVFDLTIFFWASGARAQGLSVVPASSLQQLPATTTDISAPRAVPHLVRVNVVVQDRAGNPVAGLTRDDFILLDDGRPQAIQEFAVVTNQPVDQYTPAMLADTYSNRFEDHQRMADSLTVVLLDGINTRFEDPAYARRQTLKFLDQIQAGDHVAVYLLGRELEELQDFSGDSTRLVTELKKYQLEPHAAMDDTLPRERLGYHIEARPRGEDLLAPFLHSNVRPETAIESETQLRRTAESLAAIANHLAALPGRKALIWVTGELPPLLHPSGYGPSAHRGKDAVQSALEETVRALNAADVAIYPVDARALMQPEQLQQKASLRSETAEDELTRRAKMNEWSAFTGGREIDQPVRISSAIRAALADSAMSYELGYYADAAGDVENVHFLAVSVRRMGVRVHGRACACAARLCAAGPAAAGAAGTARGAGERGEQPARCDGSGHERASERRDCGWCTDAGGTSAIRRAGCCVRRARWCVDGRGGFGVCAAGCE